MAGAGSAARRLYARAADPEAWVPAEAVELIRAELRRVPADTGQSVEPLITEAATWSSAAAHAFSALRNVAGGEDRLRLIRRAALGWAPIGLASGALLQWLTSPGNADTPLSLDILRLYARDVGVGHPAAARGSAYLGLLRQLRASENAIPLARLAGDPRIADQAFQFPAFLLLMSRRPDDFRDELVGADLCLRAVGLPPPLALARSELWADWAAIDYSAAAVGDQPPLEQCREIAETLLQSGPESAARVYGGFGWAMDAVTRHTAALHQELTASLDPRYEMAELLRLRSREGAVYHRQVVLQARPLSDWLKDCRTDPGPFLDALAASTLVVPGRAADSWLINGLAGDAGPMFRVFSPADLRIIGRWIDALGTAESAAGTATFPEPAAGAGQPSDPDRWLALAGLLETAAEPGADRPDTLREAYQALMGRTTSAELHEWCLAYVRGWLARARHGMDSRSVPLPQRWTAEGLRSWLQAQHDRHGAEFEATADTPLPSREEVVADAVQTAPLTLIDGSWLQGFTDYELASSDIGHSLFATYWDELGNGVPALNHPRIYREVLREMEIDLPPTASPEFANWPGFSDTAFELPVYWLCIGRFPRTFLPEVLGLNLAMELSGVGGSYRRASTALRKYGFSTRFVDIHNTIDNVATGHSAWAADAVDTLMASLPDSSGPGGRTEAWDRVRAGFRSLNPPSGFRARRAGRRGQLATRPRRADPAPVVPAERASG